MYSLLSHRQGYTKPREYIVTEWPLKHTPGDFWSLVYDYECSAVVVLCVPPKDSVRILYFHPPLSIDFILIDDVHMSARESNPEVNSYLAPKR